jgi:hypothetical protein
LQGALCHDCAKIDSGDETSAGSLFLRRCRPPFGAFWSFNFLIAKAMSKQPLEPMPFRFLWRGRPEGNYRTLLASRQTGEPSMSLTLVALSKRENVVDLKYGETVDDPDPFILTLTSQHVAYRTSKSPPISGVDLVSYVLTHVTELKTTAENCRSLGLASEILR